MLLVGSGVGSSKNGNGMSGSIKLRQLLTGQPTVSSWLKLLLLICDYIMFPLLFKLNFRGA
jgi:hypothetical protein